jgi:MOSC domain-containing protein YiiM
METVTHLSMTELEAGMEFIRLAPKNYGVLKLIVRRPQEDGRETIQQAELSRTEGLVGDNWRMRGNRHMPGGSANPQTQITIMNARSAALVAQTPDRWPLAGDQLYVDLDLSDDNLPPGTRLAIGTTVLEVSSVPHTGCKKFSDRFGVEAMKFVNTPEGKQLHLRGINTYIVQAGTIHVGDLVRKL